MVKFEDSNDDINWRIGSRTGNFQISTNTGGSLWSPRVNIKEGGYFGIGTTDPSQELQIHGIDNSVGHADIRLVSSDNEQWNIGGGEKLWFAWVDSNGDHHSHLKIDPDEGEVEITQLRIRGGSDISEPFEISENEKIKPGMVLVIDSENPGNLKTSDKPYDRCVAGIICGAGGIKPGLMLTQEDVFDDGRQVALAGRVYGLCDASYGSIQPGDLLTTSQTKGYAMKVTDYEKAQGAIIGKAMSNLDEGKGLVLILVSLQ
jgi:hypothetical protein